MVRHRPRHAGGSGAVWTRLTRLDVISIKFSRVRVTKGRMRKNASKRVQRVQRGAHDGTRSQCGQGETGLACLPVSRSSGGRSPRARSRAPAREGRSAVAKGGPPCSSLACPYVTGPETRTLSARVAHAQDPLSRLWHAARSPLPLVAMRVRAVQRCPVGHSQRADHRGGACNRDDTRVGDEDRDTELRLNAGAGYSRGGQALRRRLRPHAARR